MLVSQKVAIAAHLHVLLRRKTGRVTDTEWMAENLEYALAIVRFARAKAAEDGIPELDEWAGKLERAVLEPEPARRAPLAQTAAQLIKPDPGPDSLIEPPGEPTETGPAVPRYIGGIR